MAPSRDPPAVHPDGEAGPRRQRDIVPCGVLKSVPALHPGSDAGGRTSVTPTGLLVAGEKLEPLQVVCPNAERARTGVSADEVMTSVSESWSAVRYSVSFGQNKLDDKSDVLVSGKVDSRLDVFDTGRVDNVDGVSAPGAVARGVLREQTSIALRPLAQDGDRVVQVKGCPACVVCEETARLSVEIGRGAVAHGRRREWVEQSTSNRLIQSAPFMFGWPRCVSREGFAALANRGRRYTDVSEGYRAEIPDNVRG